MSVQPVLEHLVDSLNLAKDAVEQLKTRNKPSQEDLNDRFEEVRDALNQIQKTGRTFTLNPDQRKRLISTIDSIQSNQSLVVQAGVQASLFWNSLRDLRQFLQTIHEDKKAGRRVEGVEKGGIQEQR